MCDVGAGTGNYTNALADRGYRIEAIEPSVVMRQQATPHPAVAWWPGYAEQLPLRDSAVSGVICTLACHHFTDLEAALREMDRVAPRGPFVFFTFDPASQPRPWFDAYFPEIVSTDTRIFHPMADFSQLGERVTGRTTTVEGFALPCDLQDRMMYAPWNRPEAYFDATFRANTSGFSKADPQIIEKRLKKLEMDIASGAWDRQHGPLRTATQYHAGFYFIAFRPRARP
jgi:SAM-dependent methyltransferase